MYWVNTIELTRVLTTKSLSTQTASFSDLPHRFKWLDWFYDFILLGYIHFYVCYSATNQIHKQIRRKFESGKKGEMRWVRNISRGLSRPPVSF